MAVTPAPQRDHERERPNRTRQPRQRQVVGVEDGDDRDREVSSTIATVSRSSFTPDDTRSPRSASTPTANAMSVAAGIAQPAASDCRQCRRASLAQLAGDELALDLKADDEEERPSAPSSTAVAEVLGQRSVSEADRRLLLPDAHVLVTGRLLAHTNATTAATTSATPPAASSRRTRRAGPAPAVPLISLRPRRRWDFASPGEASL
jgi:hypothetical protein